MKQSWAPCVVFLLRERGSLLVPAGPWGLMGPNKKTWQARTGTRPASLGALATRPPAARLTGLAQQSLASTMPTPHACGRLWLRGSASLNRWSARVPPSVPLPALPHGHTNGITGPPRLAAKAGIPVPRP